MNTSIAHQALLRWFQEHARPLPWRIKNHDEAQYTLRVGDEKSHLFDRRQRDPYRVLVAELMLQQTQVDRVLPKYLSFLQAWPNVNALANAPLSDVLIAWRGLGYNRRARYLWSTAKSIVATYGGIFPITEDELLLLPGVGKYTARAILVFAFQQDLGVSDTNIQRIFARAWLGTEAKEVVGGARSLWELIDQSVPGGQSDPWSQGLMDLGAMLCTASKPRCEECPLRSLCVANHRAQELGFAGYGDFLRNGANVHIQSQSRKSTLRFQDTDRFFRGRVLDMLRDSSIPMEELSRRMREEYGLEDLPRWGRIIEALMIEKLIQIRGSVVSLPSN